MKIKLTEVDFVKIVSDYLLKDNDTVYLEVPNMGQSIDIVAIKDTNIYAIEVKLANWKQAIKQCKAHKVIADYICIALYKKNISFNGYTEIKNNNLGLILYDKKCFGKIFPPQNKEIWLPQRKQFEGKLANGCYSELKQPKNKESK